MWEMRSSLDKKFKDYQMNRVQNINRKRQNAVQSSHAGVLKVPKAPRRTVTGQAYIKARRFCASQPFN